MGFGGSAPFLLLFASCMPAPLELEDMPNVRPEMVVATQMVTDQSVLVLLTRTFSALERKGGSSPEEILQQLAVNDAVVVITGSGGTDTLVFSENGLYIGVDIHFVAGESYTLQVSSETLGTVSATTQVQERVVMETADADMYYEGLEDTLMIVNYELLDPSEENRYLLNVQKVGMGTLLQNFINPELYTLLFKDTDFNGEPYSDSFIFFPEDFAAGDTILVSLANISQDYYQFLELRAEKRINLLEFLSEPFNYPSNIEGGKGFFNLHLPDVRLLVLEEQR